MFQPKTGLRCTCRKGVQRDNCPECEGTGWCIDFHAIRKRAAKQQGGDHDTQPDAPGLPDTTGRPAG